MPQPGQSPHNGMPADPIRVYELPLEPDGSPNKRRQYVRLPPPLPPYVLRLSIDAGAPASRNGILFTNFPLDGSPFVRHHFHRRELPADPGKPIQVDLHIVKAGAFEFYVEHDENSRFNQGQSSQLGDVPSRLQSKHCYFNVDPLLTLPSRSSILDAETLQPLPVGKGGLVQVGTCTPLPLDALVIQSIVAKWMGPLDTWTPHLDNIRDRGYNVLHFTPLQQRGESNSPYSIYDQLAFSDDLFSGSTQSEMSVEARSRCMQDYLARLKSQDGFLSITDVVWNHTANNSTWLEDHPDSGYNVKNSPHLEAALELDSALLEFSINLESKYGLQPQVDSFADLDAVMSCFEKRVLPSLQLWQYYVIDVQSALIHFADAKAAGREGCIKVPEGLSRHDTVELFAESCLPKDWQTLGKRYKPTVDIEAALSFTTDESEFQRFCNDINVDRYAMFNDDVRAIIDNTRSRIQYMRVDSHGPRLGLVTAKSPLSDNYFTRLKNGVALANNGWIWNADPMCDFAGPQSRAYLRREVIGWGDCVKLRYGNAPEDSPFLWQHMERYTVLMATTFHGFRIDNCHSTPIHVGEFLLDAARRANPNLYVCAELFTGSEELDTYFVSRLGINSLIREAMNGHDANDESRLLYIYGLGKPVGSMDYDCLVEHSSIALEGQELQPCVIEQLQGSVPHAFVMDCTHDNESPKDKRTAEDALATGALVPMCWAAVGSNRGFDDLYPKLLNLVTDSRTYEVYTAPDTSGIGIVKRVLNHLHTEMALAGFKEGHLHQEEDYIIAHRTHPSTHKGYIVVSRTAFKGSQGRQDRVSPIILRQAKVRFVLGFSVHIENGDDTSDSNTFRGLQSRLVPLSAPAMTSRSDDEGPFVEIQVPPIYPAGSVMLLATEMEGLDAEFDELCLQGADQAFRDCTAVDLNVVLFRADGEERDVSGGQVGAYRVEGMDALPYCGLEGWMYPLRHIMSHNDLGHPLCAHLRKGPWAMDYIVSRLQREAKGRAGLQEPAAYFAQRFRLVKTKSPGYMRPRFFAMIVNAAYRAARASLIAQCSPFIRQGDRFVQSLALVSTQMYGHVDSASLNPGESTPSLAAGLPHFSAGWARCWGRDVFISLRGLFLTTGQFDAARLHLLAFASVIKHGLVPNLLDSLRTPRYNSRDSPWWYLQALQDYTRMSPEGVGILQSRVKRRFPADDTWVPWNDSRAYSNESSVAEVVQEIMQRHASGIHFREYNAGPNLDSQMESNGFQVDIEVDWQTGFLHGGNEFNCGTWMDKMGESERAGTKGRPGTPRDGAPIEITGLLKSTLRWLAELSCKNQFPFNGIDVAKDGRKTHITYDDWQKLIQGSFERCYHVPCQSSEDPSHVVNPEYVCRRGIYKDVYGTPAPRSRSDYQLRANYPIAMTVAPELFDEQHALKALRIYEEHLVGPLGVATLDPADSDYRPYYDNANDGDDPAVAKGRNYHQGPEWVWPLGYFLRAYIHFDLRAGRDQKDQMQTFHHICARLLQHRCHLFNDRWAGLPELTNKQGEYCRDSCETQAWSASTLLDALESMFVIQAST